MYTYCGEHATVPCASFNSFCSRHSRAFFVPGFLKCRHARLSAQTDGGRVIKSTYERRWTNLRPSWRASWKGEKKLPRRAKSSSFREHFCFISTPHSFDSHRDNASLKWSGKKCLRSHLYCGWLRG